MAASDQPLVLFELKNVLSHRLFHFLSNLSAHALESLCNLPEMLIILMDVTDKSESHLVELVRQGRALLVVTFLKQISIKIVVQFAYKPWFPENSKALRRHPPVLFRRRRQPHGLQAEQ